MRVYGFQITPGSDNYLGYCESMDLAYQKGLEHRHAIRLEAAPSRLEPTAVYEIELAEMTAEALVAVLNDPDALPKALVLSKRLLGFAMQN